MLASLRRRVVWLDDNPADIASAAAALQSQAKLEVRVVAKGVEALQLVATEPQPDLFIVDLLLEGDLLNGLDVAKQARVVRPSMPIVAVTEHLWSFVGEIVSSLKASEYPFAWLWEKYEFETATGLRKFAAEVSFLFTKQERLRGVCGQFEALLNQDPPEGRIKQFVKDNQVVLHQFSPDRAIFEAPILTFYKADIAVLTSGKRVLLIEFETPQTRLLNKDGGVSAELQHALDQVRNWLHVTQWHQVAVLKCLGLGPQDVTRIRGVVIAGRDCDYPEEHLQRLKGTSFGEIDLFTYDDLLRSLANLSRILGGV